MVRQILEHLGVRAAPLPRAPARDPEDGDGHARVDDAVQRLRRLGLADVLRTRDDGDVLDAETSTRLAGRPPPAGR